MFLGTTLAGNIMASSNATASEELIKVLKFTNMIIDELYATRNILIQFDWQIPDEWDYNTHLHGKFQGNTHAGNVGYSEKNVDRIKIKKRLKGDFDWKTIYEKEIHSKDDFKIEFLDYYNASGQEYEYSYVAVIANTDSEAFSSSIYSDFDSYFICDKNESYPLILDQTNEVTYNRESTTIVSPGRKYPYVVNNGIAQYYSGVLNVTFIELKENCHIDLENGWNYRRKIDQFLANGRAKILKSFEGEMWMVNIVGSLPRKTNNHYWNVSHEINWTECGDPTLISDLYDNGFIDTDVDRE